MRNPGAGRLVGLDLGSRRIGVAVSDSDRIVASGLQAVDRSGSTERDHRAIAALVDEYGAAGVVVGIPLSMSGQAGEAARRTLAEVEALRGVLAVPVYTIDERLTTVEASRSLRTGGRSARRQRAIIDQTAAALLLQTWMDRQRGLARTDASGTRGDEL